MLAAIWVNLEKWLRKDAGQVRYILWDAILCHVQMDRNMEAVAAQCEYAKYH